MRHRQTTGAGPTGARPSIVILLLTAAGGGLTVGFGQPAGVWAGYGAATVAALAGCATLLQQRGLMERHVKDTARRRRADLEEAAVAERRYRGDLDRVRTELEHEQQYSVLIQNQLARAREQLDRERAARRDAERELDALTGTGGWQSGKPPVEQRPAKPSVLLTVEEPMPSRDDVAKAGAANAEQAVEDTQTVARPMTTGPVLADAAEPGVPSAAPRPGLSAAQRRGWQIVDGDGEDGGESLDAELLYRPFLDQLTAAPVPVSDAALAAAPVIGAVDLDGILDLTAYDETIEFSVREIKQRMA